MRWGISNGGRSARCLGEMSLAAGELLYVADGLPGNEFDEFDTGLVIDVGVVRAKTPAELTADAAIVTEIASDKTTLKAQAAQAILDINAYLLTADAATNAQVRAEVKEIDIRQRVIIRALRRLL
jgi:hypothetical protein